MTPKEEPTTDLYLFAMATATVRSCTPQLASTGPTSLPRFVPGNWWSRYHRYGRNEYRQLVERFEKEGIPFTTAVIMRIRQPGDDVDPKYARAGPATMRNKDFFRIPALPQLAARAWHEGHA